MAVSVSKNMMDGHQQQHPAAKNQIIPNDSVLGKTAQHRVFLETAN